MWSFENTKLCACEEKKEDNKTEKSKSNLSVWDEKFNFFPVLIVIQDCQCLPDCVLMWHKVEKIAMIYNHFTFIPKSITKNHFIWVVLCTPTTWQSNAHNNIKYAYMRASWSRSPRTVEASSFGTFNLNKHTHALKIKRLISIEKKNKYNKMANKKQRHSLFLS